MTPKQGLMMHVVLLNKAAQLQVSRAPQRYPLKRLRRAHSSVSEAVFEGAKMADEMRAELYTSPGGKFIRSDTLTRILAHWRSFRSADKRKHFIKYDGELYEGDEVDNLQLPGK